MYCKNCNFTTSNNDEFCQQCGSKMLPDNTVQTAQPEFNNIPEPKRPKKKKLGLFVTLAMLLVALSSAATVFVYSTFFDPSDSPDKPSVVIDNDDDLNEDKEKNKSKNDDKTETKTKDDDKEKNKSSDGNKEEPQKKEAPSTDNYDVKDVSEDITIVVDGREITPTDNNGNEVETIVHDGIIYLPVKTVADMAGKSYYWDGPNYTVYLGNMEGTLEYPTVEMEKMTSINEQPESSESLTDNYGNRYSRAITNYSYDNYRFEYLLNMKYSKFKAVLYVPEGTTSAKTGYVQIIADGKTIYTSPEMTRSSQPVVVDVNITGYNDVKIEFSGYSYYDNCVPLRLGEAGFYQ